MSKLTCYRRHADNGGYAGMGGRYQHPSARRARGGSSLAGVLCQHSVRLWLRS
jgi:hypothetical protein